MLETLIQKSDHFPSIKDFFDTAADLGIKKNSEKNAIQYPDCDKCDSMGFEDWESENGNRCIVACRFCEKGKLYKYDKKYGCSDRDDAMKLGYLPRERRT